MARAELDGITLAYVDAGLPTGAPVLFIHGGFVADAFQPLLAEPALATHYRLIAYQRRGYGASAHPPGPVSIAQQVADARALLALLGVTRAHVVGHSFGGDIALQLALDAPNAVQTLGLLEPALMIGASATGYRTALEAGAQRFHSVGAAVTVDEFLEARWPGYREPLARALPDALTQATADAATWFESEVPALVEWRFGEAEARRIGCPVLSVLGGKSDALWPRFGEVHRWLLDSLPQAEALIVPDATHFLQIERPRELAEGLATFFARNPGPA